MSVEREFILNLPVNISIDNSSCNASCCCLDFVVNPAPDKVGGSKEERGGKERPVERTAEVSDGKK